MFKPIIKPISQVKNLLYLVRRMSLLPANQSIEGPAITSIKAKVHREFPTATHFAIFNDSYKHKGHEGVASSPNKTESHIRIELVSDKFEGVKLPMRHRMIYKLIGDEMEQYHIHAVQLKTKTPEEIAKTIT
ncbi:bolA-like protein 1 [Monosporozyma unispora]|nr:hypothetical protein C6P44_002801 [Kazachstania unispora]